MVKEKNENNFYGRRAFLVNCTALTGAAMLTAAPQLTFAGEGGGIAGSYTIEQVIDIILKEISGAPFATTVDQLRSGSMQQEVSGIVTTMFPTIEVIEKTIKAGGNFIIAHETRFIITRMRLTGYSKTMFSGTKLIY
ncbi:MAG: Nif3-like dinuclear metal center hexameric protein [Bacteroidota bacterium]|nr:Nif3-like dinuclear metal center hexameric protein [Bacteroidota bacterium]